MSSHRRLLDEAIDKGETEGGSVEFKESLSETVHLADNKRQSLVAQMRHRVVSGDGEATYVVGVTDDGDISGLKQEQFEETLNVLSVIAEESDSHISNVETFSAEEDKLVGLVTVNDGVKENIQSESHLVIGTAGHVDHGKSTLVGTLVTGDSDDGEGAQRSYLDVKPHEVERGLSADLSYAVYGFKDGEAMNLGNPNRKDERSNVVEEADKVISFVDTVGHQPWLSTAIRGLVGQKLDYGLLAISADDGPTKTTKEHLGVLLAMELPTVIAITKTDLVSDERVEEVEREIEGLLRDTGCSPITGTRYDNEAIIDEISSNVVPIIRTSAVEMEGMEKLDDLLKNLPVRENTESGEFNMYVDRTYVVEGVGTVVSGTVRSGSVEEGDSLLLGPTADGEFIETKARSIEIHYHRVNEATAGQLVSIAVRNVKPDQVRRGMVLLKKGANHSATKEFEAEVMVLNHPTRISNGYEPFVHLETIGETVRMYPEDNTLLPGETGKARFKFKFNPYYLEEGQRFVFREGQSKGVGTVTDID